MQAELRSRRPGFRRRPGGPGGRVAGRPGRLGGGRGPGLRAPGLHLVPGRVQVSTIELVTLCCTVDQGDSSHQASSSQASRRAGSQDCDYYTDGLCLGVRDYPRSEIVRLLGANRRMSADMIADVSKQSADDLIDGVSSSEFSAVDVLCTVPAYCRPGGELRLQPLLRHQAGGRQPQAPRLRPGAVNNTGCCVAVTLCRTGGSSAPARSSTPSPSGGRRPRGCGRTSSTCRTTPRSVCNGLLAMYKILLVQTLRMEKCLKPGGSCSYVSHHYKSQCSQVLVWYALHSRLY